jgi:hypothetical protein
MDQVARTLLVLLLLAAVASVVPLVDGVRQTRAVLWSAARGAVQLLVIGLLLGAVFRAPLSVLPVLAVMVAAATATVTPRLAGLPAQGRRQALGDGGHALAAMPRGEAGPTHPRRRHPSPQRKSGNEAWGWERGHRPRWNPAGSPPRP